MDPDLQQVEQRNLQQPGLEDGDGGGDDDDDEDDDDGDADYHKDDLQLVE